MEKKMARWYRSLAVPVVVAILFSSITLGGCGNIQSKDNGDKYSVYNNPTVIGSTKNELSTFYEHVGSCDSALGQIVADSMLYSGLSGAQIGLINAGSVRWRPSKGIANDKIPAGNLTKGDVDLFLPFDNLTGISPATAPATIVMVSLTGKLLKSVMENSFSRMLATGMAGTSYGRFLQPSGSLKVWADVTKPVGSRITRMQFLKFSTSANAWQAVNDIDMTDTTVTYRVVVASKYVDSTTSSSKDSTGDGHQPILMQGTDIVDTKTYVYNAVVDLISKYSPLDYSEPVSCTGAGNRLVITHQ